MNKIMFCIGIIILFFISICGCQEKVSTFVSDQRLIGAWESRDTYLEMLMFFPDGTWTVGNSEGRWTINNHKLEIANNAGVITTYEYSFSNNDNILKLTNIETHATYTYTKP